MRVIQVDRQQNLASSGRVISLAGLFDQHVSELGSSAGELLGVWNGQAATAFMNGASIVFEDLLESSSELKSIGTSTSVATLKIIAQDLLAALGIGGGKS